MEHCLTVVGIGPGSPDYILPVARREIEGAAVLAGGARTLATYAKPHQLTYKVDADIAGLLNFIRRQLDLSDVVVMVSGDPGYYSLLATLRLEFPVEKLRVIPGVSSFQVAFARIGLPWQSARLMSAHGRQPEMAQMEYRQGEILAFLTDGKNHPSRIAGWLREQGWPACTRVWLCKNLSYEDEMIMTLSLEEALDIAGFESCVMVVAG